MFNIIIIGGMAAGCKAAARLSRLSCDYRITIIEKSDIVSVSRCGFSQLVAGEIDNIYELTKTPYGIKRDKNFFSDFEGMTVLLKTEATEINPWKKEVICTNHQNNETQRLKYDALILATGCKPECVPFAYPKSSRISYLHYAGDVIKLREYLQKGQVKKAVVIGGGIKGLETAESLVSLWGTETIIIEKESRLLKGCIDLELSRHIEKCINSDKILVLLSTSVNKIETDRNGLPVILLDNGQKINSDYVIFCTETEPETELAAKTNIRLGTSKGIIVDEKMRTSIPDIWAAGECVEIKNLVTGEPDYLPGGSLANRSGRAVADSIDRKKIDLKGIVGTTSLRLFNTEIYSAGLTEQKARKSGVDTGSVIGIWSDRADFDPDVKNMFGKLVYQKSGLKLLGLQLIGTEQVARYIDVFCELLKERRTIKSLLCLEHAFNPFYSTPITPLNYLGYMAVNQEKDGIKNYNPLYISSFKGMFIDVREKHDAEAKPLTLKSINIPFSVIRKRIKDFNSNQQIIFICTKGGRSYESARLFLNHGFKHVAYLGGGSMLLNELHQVAKPEEMMS